MTSTLHFIGAQELIGLHGVQVVDEFLDQNLGQTCEEIHTIGDRYTGTL